MKNRNLPQISIILFLTLLLSLPLTLTQTQAATLKAPKPAVRQINNYLQVSWSKVPGAQGYVIYTKNSQSASWKKVKTVSAGTVKYNYKTVTSGKRYYFTVRAYRKTGGKIVYGAYSKTGVSCYYLTKPSLRISEKTHKSVTLSWNKVPGATGYKVIRNDSVIADTKELKYTDSVEPNTKYTYTVRAYKGTSYVDSSVVNVTTPKIPVNEAIETKVYEGENGYGFIEFKNVTAQTYYNIKATMEYFDTDGQIIWRVSNDLRITYIKPNDTAYISFSVPNINYAYYKIDLERFTGWEVNALNSIKIENININANEVSYTISNTSDNIIYFKTVIICLKDGFPVYQCYGAGGEINIYQKINFKTDQEIKISNFNDVKIQIKGASFR